MTSEAETTRPAETRVAGVRRNERIAGFSDGVFAIAITLLALELKVPEHAPPGGLIALLPELLPKLLGHAISFAVLGIYWVGHHNMFLHIVRHDRVLLWLNILFLLFVATMPFLSSLLAAHATDQFAVIAYALTLVLAGLVLDLIWTYATHKRRLVDPGLDDRLVAIVHRRVLLAPALYLAAIAASFLSLTAATVIFVLVIVLYVVPGPLDVRHHQQLGASE